MLADMAALESLEPQSGTLQKAFRSHCGHCPVERVDASPES
jgi:hypothetical protein